MTKIGRHCFVSGVVQGVFYRQNTKEQADKRHLTGWVKNLNDGRVEVLLFGAEDQINSMLEWLAQGPARAQVTNLEVLATPVVPLESFTILRE